MSEELTVSLTMRITPTDKTDLDNVSARFAMIKPLTIARLAFRLGMAAIKANPSVLFQSEEGLASVQARLAAGQPVPTDEMYNAVAHQLNAEAAQKAPARPAPAIPRGHVQARTPKKR